jgi:hypothetical protein
MPLWPKLRHLFDVDDGSLPDINIENLTDVQIVSAYEWLMNQCEIVLEPTLWNIELKSNVLIRELPYPARDFISGKVESFRHCLSELRINGIALPQLSVCVEAGGLSFDYKMGEGWNEQTVTALFDLLCQIRAIAPSSRIFQTEEGGYNNPNPEFSEELEKYCSTLVHPGVQAGRRRSASPLNFTLDR